MDKNNIPLKGVSKFVETKLMKDTWSNLVTVSVMQTMDYKNGPEPRPSEWQGYRLKFTDGQGKGKDVIAIVGAGELLNLQEETGVQIFTETPDGLLLNHFRFGIKDKKPFTEAKVAEATETAPKKRGRGKKKS